MYVDVPVPTFVHGPMADADDCHCIVPALPVNVNSVLKPEHKVEAPLMLPAVGDGLTVIVSIGVVAVQLPFVTVA